MGRSRGFTSALPSSALNVNPLQVSAMTNRGRIGGLSPFPWSPYPGCLGALRRLVAAEGLVKGLFKGAAPMVIIGVSQALVLGAQRHMAFVRRVGQ